MSLPEGKEPRTDRQTWDSGRLPCTVSPSPGHWAVRCSELGTAGALGLTLTLSTYLRIKGRGKRDKSRLGGEEMRDTR